MRDDSVSQSWPAAGIVGAGARYRPSLRIAAGGSGRTTPNTSGVARSRKTTMAKYRRWRRTRPNREPLDERAGALMGAAASAGEGVTGSASIRSPRDAKAPISSPFDPQRLKPMKMERVAIARRLGEAQAREAGEQDPQAGTELEPRQRRADAEMNAGAETHMRIRRPPAVEGVGVGKARGIAIGGAEKKADPVALPKPHACELCVLQRVALKKMQRRVEAQQLLDRRRSRAFARKRKARVDAPLEHRLHPVADRLDRRLVARVQEQDHRRNQFVLAQPSAVAFGDEELADEIVAEIAPPRARKAADEI